MVKLLLENGADANCRGKNLETPLFNAAYYGKSLEPIKFSKNIFYSCRMYTSFNAGHLNIMKLLIDYDANINLPNKIGTTPIAVAACQGE